MNRMHFRVGLILLPLLNGLSSARAETAATCAESRIQILETVEYAMRDGSFVKNGRISMPNVESFLRRNLPPTIQGSCIGEIKAGFPAGSFLDVNNGSSFAFSASAFMFGFFYDNDGALQNVYAKAK